MVKFSIVKITPEEYSKLPNFTVTYGSTETKFGKCLIGLNNDNICFAQFEDGNYSALPDMKNNFPKANFVQDDQAIQAKTRSVFETSKEEDEVKILLKGTEFQTKVWEQLVNLPKGSTYSYEDVAKAIGNPKAIRAVANAVAKNNMSYFVPCHRVISKGGGIGKYRWGAEKKLQILKDENAI